MPTTNSASTYFPKTPHQHVRAAPGPGKRSDLPPTPLSNSSHPQQPRPRPSTHLHAPTSFGSLNKNSKSLQKSRLPMEWIDLCSSESDGVVDQPSRKENDRTTQSKSAEEVTSEAEVVNYDIHPIEDEDQHYDVVVDDDDLVSSCSRQLAEMDDSSDSDSYEDVLSESFLSAGEMEDIQVPSTRVMTRPPIQKEGTKEEKLIRVAVMFLLGKSKKSMQRRTGLSISRITRLLQIPSAGSIARGRRRRIFEAAQDVFDREWDQKYNNSRCSHSIAEDSNASPRSAPSSPKIRPGKPPLSRSIFTSHPGQQSQAAPSRLVAYRYSDLQLVTYYRTWLMGLSKIEASRRSGVLAQSAAAFFWNERMSQWNRERRRRIVAIAEKEAAKAQRKGRQR
ncbi:BZ3500_MvSof-1268-A1-R1_Chr1-3g02514 [Microbotryum saponariae]|uniref:BZ3500_MvSof-1268-A1-R1_Chr1-3g02514 protein n=1 Tax=Microbotryum saponariae TaxID=289078 RepID=A0A2X0KXI3_9BASI|nr:BZ3500_MvSof-1268-A1-R1_Chr1-3g02514 [Microbotryum saponariae]SCZ96451.1 BZ3501_MvSof-1269-A2-R1_Chr1-3g02117 [Microbotryum saponariae]